MFENLILSFFGAIVGDRIYGFDPQHSTFINQDTGAEMTYAEWEREDRAVAQDFLELSCGWKILASRGKLSLEH